MNETLPALEQLLTELQRIISEIKDATRNTKPEVTDESFDSRAFFDVIRPLFGKLTASAVAGTEAKLAVFRAARLPLSHVAYALATSFHETAKRMQPVREGLNASDAWRKKNLRYYPYYGRGDVQLTWLANYQKADQELGLGGRLVADLDLALDPHISAQIMLKGMTEGWFTGKKLKDYLPSSESSKYQFTQARRIINGTDKAVMIAEYAMIFQEALKKGGW